MFFAYRRFGRETLQQLPNYYSLLRFGSLFGTPIINPPQSAILGMHNIVERPVAINGKVEIRPIMYVALSYDHRIVDGEQAVRFLVDVKEALENPERMLLQL